MTLANILRAKLFVIAVIAMISITTLNIVICYLFLPCELTEKKTIIIKPNLSIHEISILLKKEKIIKHRLFFEILSTIYSLRHHLKSGEYELTAKITPYQILIKLASGTSIVHRFVIKDGQTVNEVIDQLNNEERLFGTITSNIPEAYLMPSTYFYSYGDRKEVMINKMRSEMSKALDDVMLRLPQDSPLKNRRDVLILASIVEKEAGNDRERPMIAGVFINRLRKGMMLQADPTVIYAITQGKSKMNRSLTRKDLLVESDYNTYLIKGLPIGPISCPGRASLESVVAPARTDALYFVANGERGHYFAKNLNEHNVNVARYKQTLFNKKLNSIEE